ncbi:hypothetical protein KUTeg_024008 [Tegillarca granosa]|uniref:Uncharacterized protein n=1 Tax=Tegillarca granosa TaxID=220873 RepID=A0ABQ9E1P6_TEGGR|nr:hypothetical protein KUTeg_024008 [Tegillarca granosa]
MDCSKALYGIIECHIRCPNIFFFRRSSLHNVSDLFVMGGALIFESIVLLNWCERHGLGPLGLTGILHGRTFSSLFKQNIDQDVLDFMIGVMDEFTYLGNFSIPVDTSLIIIVHAKQDAYIPRGGVPSLEDLWPGSEVRFIDTGHVIGCAAQQSVFRDSSLPYHLIVDCQMGMVYLRYSSLPYDLIIDCQMGMVYLRYSSLRYYLIIDCQMGMVYLRYSSLPYDLIIDCQMEMVYLRYSSLPYHLIIDCQMGMVYLRY